MVLLSKILRALRRRQVAFACAPLRDVCALGNGIWETTGPDPVIRLTPLGPWPSGWLRTHLQGDVRGLLRYEPTHSGIILHRQPEFWLPAHVPQLELAVEKQGTFTLQSIALEEITSWEHRLAHYSLPKGLPSGDLKGKAKTLLKALKPTSYASWVLRYGIISSKQRRQILQDISNLDRAPLLSILMPVYNTPPQYLQAAIDSVLGQLYPHWELCIADDASPNPDVRAVLEGYQDPRIKVVYRASNGHISAASNSALELAQGGFTALLDHDDELAPDALYWVAKEIIAHPEVKLLFSDEDKIDIHGMRYDPYFKSEFNQDLFYSHNMITHLGVYDTALLRDIGGFRVGLEGSQDYDLALRVVEKVEPSQIRHIPRILYHWRAIPGSTAVKPGEKSYAYLAAQRAIQEHFNRIGVKATVEEVPGLGVSRARYAIPEGPPLVTLVIPTKNRADLLSRCLDGVLNRTEYLHYEVLIVDNASDEPESLALLKDLSAHPKVRILQENRPFNYSALNNLAVHQAQGTLIGLLNNDLEVIDSNWLEEMISHALRPEIGAVGARLWYPDDTLQHGGVILGIGGVAGHAHKGLKRGEYGYMGRAVLQQNFSAVSAACLVMRRAIYLEVGGLDEALAVAFNDIDLCLRLLSRGYRILWTPYAELYHHESASRGLEDSSEKRIRFAQEILTLRRRWGGLLDQDPAYSPNLSLEKEDFGWSFPPRSP